MKKIKPFLKTFGKGLAKELVSYVPVIGDNLANSIEKKVGKQISNDQTENIVEVIGKVIIGGLVIAAVVGWISLEDLKEIVKIIE